MLLMQVSRLFWLLFTLVMTLARLKSSFFCMIWVLFPSLGTENNLLCWLLSGCLSRILIFPSRIQIEKSIGSRILIRTKVFKHFLPNYCYWALVNMVQDAYCGSRIWIFSIPDPREKLRIPDPLHWRKFGNNKVEVGALYLFTCAMLAVFCCNYRGRSGIVVVQQ